MSAREYNRTVALLAGAGVAVFAGSIAGGYIWARSHSSSGKQPRPDTPPPPKAPQPQSSSTACDVPIGGEFVVIPPLKRGRWGDLRDAAAQLEEYLRSCGASMHHISTRELTALPRTGDFAIPARELWPRVVRTVRVWERIRERFGSPIMITSGYRPEQYNRAIGGVAQSMHVMGAALDFTVDDVAKREQLAKIALDVFHERGPVDAIGLGIYGYPSVSHIHLDTGKRFRVIQDTPRWRKRFPPPSDSLPVRAGPWRWRGWSGETVGYGSQPVLVFHGMSATIEQLKPYLDLTRARYWLVEGQVPASAGGWNYTATRSSSPQFGVALRRLIDDLDPLVDAIRRHEGRELSAIGYSQGGHIALALAARGAARVAVTASATLSDELVPSGPPPAALKRLLMLHGEDDRVVGPARSRGIADALSSAGWPVEWIGLPDVGHELRKIGPAIRVYSSEVLRT